MRQGFAVVVAGQSVLANVVDGPAEMMKKAAIAMYAAQQTGMPCLAFPRWRVGLKSWLAAH